MTGRVEVRHWRDEEPEQLRLDEELDDFDTFMRREREANLREVSEWWRQFGDLDTKEDGWQ